MPRHRPPEGYQTPPFPSLYPHLRDETPRRDWTLYYVGDIWRFTLLWTLIIYALFHVCAAAVAILTHGKSRAAWKLLWTVPLVYLAVAGIEAVFAGSITGLILGAVYTAGYFEMSTWMPFVWGWINLLVLLISAFSIQGGL